MSIVCHHINGGRPAFTPMQEHVPSNDRGHTLLLHHIAVQPACIPLLCLSPSFCVLFLFLLVGGYSSWPCRVYWVDSSSDLKSYNIERHCIACKCKSLRASGNTTPAAHAASSLGDWRSLLSLRFFLYSSHRFFSFLITYFLFCRSRDAEKRARKFKESERLFSSSSTTAPQPVLKLNEQVENEESHYHAQKRKRKKEKQQKNRYEWWVIVMSHRRIGTSGRVRTLPPPLIHLSHGWTWENCVAPFTCLLFRVVSKPPVPIYADVRAILRHHSLTDSRLHVLTLAPRCQAKAGTACNMQLHHRNTPCMPVPAMKDMLGYRR